MQTGVMIFEDNDNLRESLAGLVLYSKNLLLLGAYSNAQKAVTAVQENRPDVVIMDIDMPGITGIEAVKAIRIVNQAVQVLMLTVFDDNKHVYDAICAGASGYLLKKHIADKLLTSIDEIMRGEVPMSPGLARMVIQNLQALPHIDENKYNLTPREKEILASLSRGNSYKMVAAGLSISTDTVRTHIKRIYKKLQVHSQVEAITKANGERLI
jgi:DNA-binding NarL/FixJ family response regulator